jgi:sterol desaturase/sphingolipid hydroxylase (fatty acid hydroxylase superfamily)
LKHCKQPDGFEAAKYHVTGCWLGRFRWFRRKQQLHFVHHHHANTNFAVIDFFWDSLLGTFRTVDGEDDPQAAVAVQPAASLRGLVEWISGREAARWFGRGTDT